MYGKQEDEPINKGEEAYFELGTEIDRIRNISNKFIVIGYFSCKLNEEDG